jgi:predicted ester cyclase
VTDPSTRRLVERFYDEVWNEADEAVAAEILDPDLRFRSSLGLDLAGLAGFVDYMRSIHAALAGYTCVIEDLIATEHRAAARLRFSGVHRGLFFGVAPTFREISWGGAAFFTTDRGRITELWVLGDVDAVKRQLGAAPDSSLVEPG